MFSYPYAVPVPVALSFTSDAAGLVLMLAGLATAAVLASLLFRSGRRPRVVGVAPVGIVPHEHQTDLPRAAA